MKPYQIMKMLVDLEPTGWMNYRRMRADSPEEKVLIRRDHQGRRDPEFKRFDTWEDVREFALSLGIKPNGRW